MESTAVSGAIKRTAKSAPSPRILYVVSEDWYFLSHRLPMARAARDAGFEVHVATRVVDGASRILAENFVLHPIPYARGRISPGAAIITVRALRRVYHSVEPAVIHHVSLQTAILGLIAALGRPAACVNAITGFGYSATSRTIKARALGSVIKTALRFLLNREGIVSLVQNEDDFSVLSSMGIPRRRIAQIRGSGVDIRRLRPLPEPEGVPTAAFVGRLLEDKGIRTLLSAYRLLRQRGVQVQLLIAGAPDPANPSSATGHEASSWNKEPGITWLGHVSDISAVWKRACIAVLPSRREGLPLSLLEAAACARPMIASDVPGCREIVIHEQTGLLVPVGDAVALADAMARLIVSPELRFRYGETARGLVVEQFSADLIGKQVVELYARLVHRRT